MFVSRVFCRVSRSSLNHCGGISSSRNQLPQIFSNTSSDSLLLVSGWQSINKWVPRQVNAMHNMFTTTAEKQQFWYSSSASPQSNEKENSQEINNTFSKAKTETKVDDDAKSAEDTSESDTKTDHLSAETEEFFEFITKKIDFFVVGLMEIDKRKDEVSRTRAEMKNVIDQRNRQMDSLKKSVIHATQSLAKGLLDVADNLGRASSVAKDSFAKIDTSKDTAGAVPVLKTLLEGVEMTEKQLAEEWVPRQVNAMHNMFTTTAEKQQFWYSSSASPQSNEKENSQEINNTFSKAKTETKVDDDAKSAEDTSESDTETEDILELLANTEELFVVKRKEIEEWEDEVLRHNAEMKNLLDQRDRIMDIFKKSAIQSFAKGLLDVADNLGRASSVAKDSFAKIDSSSKDTAGAVPVLKTLLEGVEMTEKQIAEVLRKFGVEKFDPLNEQTV